MSNLPPLNGSEIKLKLHPDIFFLISVVANVWFNLIFNQLGIIWILQWILEWHSLVPTLKICDRKLISYEKLEQIYSVVVFCLILIFFLITKIFRTKRIICLSSQQIHIEWFLYARRDSRLGRYDREQDKQGSCPLEIYSGRRNW